MIRYEYAHGALECVTNTSHDYTYETEGIPWEEHGGGDLDQRLWLLEDDERVASCDFTYQEIDWDADASPSWGELADAQGDLEVRIFHAVLDAYRD